MMCELAALKTGKAVNKSHERVTIKRTNQHATRFLRGHEMRQRHYIEIRNTPNFLLQLFNSTHLRGLIDLAYADVENLRRCHSFDLDRQRNVRRLAA